MHDTRAIALPNAPTHPTHARPLPTEAPVVPNHWRPAVGARTLVSITRARATLQPGASAFHYLVDDVTTLEVSYAELDRRARAIAARLQQSVPMGARALLPYPPGLDFVSAFFGCLYAGVIAIPTPAPRLGKQDHTLARLHAIAENAKPSVLVSTAATLAGLEDAAGLDGLERVASDQLDLGIGASWREPELDAQTAAYLQYSSGSTGAPKGVVLTHGNVLANLALIHGAFGITRNSTGVSWLPMYHDMGLVGSVLLPIYEGGPMWLMSPVSFLQRPLRWLSAISRVGASTSGGPNFAFDLCARRITDEQKETLDLSGWSLAYTGAEPIRPDALERFAAAFERCGFRREAFFPCYGLAEATLMVSGGPRATRPRVLRVDAAELTHDRVRPTEAGREIISSGQTWPGVDVAIVNPHTQRPRAADEVGEIWVSSAAVGQGYWRRPHETAATFGARLADVDRGPYLRTGDLGFVRDGHLYVTGRIKDLVIVNGENRYPQDIERSAEEAHPAIRQAACFAVDRGEREEVVVAAEIDRHYQRGQTVDYAGVRKAVRQAVSAEHALQVQVVVLLKSGSLPLTSSGKIQRHACRSAYLGGGLLDIEEVQP